MDLSRFSIDAALFSGADASDVYRSVFYEKLLSELFLKDENLFVKTDIHRDRERIFAFPALHWLSRAEHPAERGKALYLCFDGAAAAAAQGLGERAKPLLLGADNADSPEAKSAPLVFASAQVFHDLLTTAAFAPRDFGFVVADQAELLAELPGEALRKIQGSLLPSWERKTLVIANKHTPRAKNFAWDFADNPKEMKLGETLGYAGTTSSHSFDIKEADKIRFILGLLSERGDHHLCVFCNLKSTAAELSARLAMNGVAADYIAGNLNPDRKNQIVAKALAWKGGRRDEGPAFGENGAADEAEPVAAVAPASRFPADSFILVLTDDGAKGANRPEFLGVVNYDIPLEPEFYFERLNFLKRQDPSAALYNLVCERYMYGIPAIERMIDMSLSVAPLDPALVLSEDMSAGKVIEMPEPRFRGRDFRHSSDARRSSDGRRDRDEGRGPDTRRDRDADRRGAGVQRGEPGADRRPDRGADRRAERPDRGADRGSDRGSDRGAVDPYAMSMEERLALYKRKYGGRRGEPGRREDKRGGDRGRDGGQMRDGGVKRGDILKAGGDPQKRDAQAGAPAEAAKNGEAQGETGAPAASGESRGLLGKLRDLFGAHKE